MTDTDKLQALALIEADLRQDADAVNALTEAMTAGAFVALMNLAGFLVRELASRIECEPQAVADKLRSNILEAINNKDNGETK